MYAKLLDVLSSVLMIQLFSVKFILSLPTTLSKKKDLVVFQNTMLWGTFSLNYLRNFFEFFLEEIDNSFFSVLQIDFCFLLTQWKIIMQLILFHKMLQRVLYYKKITSRAFFLQFAYLFNFSKSLKTIDGINTKLREYLQSIMVDCYSFIFYQ